jgi:hypothetical protein
MKDITCKTGLLTFNLNPYLIAISLCFDRGFLVYKSGLSPAYVGLNPDLSRGRYGYSMKMLYLKDGIVTL